MIVNNFRGIELYGSVHTSISSRSKEDSNKTFIGLEEFIGQGNIFSSLYLNTIHSSRVKPQVSSDEQIANLKSSINMHH